MPTINVPWKTVLAGLALAAIVALGFAWRSSANEAQHLREWQESITTEVTNATAPIGSDGKRVALKPADVPSAIASMRSAKESMEVALAAAAVTQQQNEVLQGKLDSGLSATLAALDKAAKGSQDRINELSNRVSSGDPNTDCVTIAADSLAPWQGWGAKP